MSSGLSLKAKSKTTRKTGSGGGRLAQLLPVLRYSFQSAAVPVVAISTSRGYELSTDLSTGFTLQRAAHIYLHLSGKFLIG